MSKRRSGCPFQGELREWTLWTGWTHGRGLAKLERMELEPLLPKHGGYRKLKSFQIAQLCYDVTVRFCGRYISSKSRTHDQMVQAARSGVQNIAEGSKASGTRSRDGQVLRAKISPVRP